MINIWANARRIVPILILLAIWEMVSGYLLPAINPHLVILMPPPSKVISAGGELLARGVLIEHTLASLKRWTIGVGLAILTAFPLGLSMGISKIVNDVFDPVVTLLRPIPPLAVIPLSILWFGIGDTQNSFIIFLGAFWPTLLGTISGVRRVDRVLIWATLNLGATRLRVIRDVVIPSAMSSVMTGIRLSIGIGWVALVAAELVASTSGLGYLIDESRQLLASDRVILGMFTIGLLGLGTDVAARSLERRFTKWTRGT
jgi:ABC-type nitrate/sulfonate/bicarbonate transport system permease component